MRYSYWSLQKYNLGCSGSEREVSISGIKAMLNWIDNVIKLDTDEGSDRDSDHGLEQKPQITQVEADTVSTDEILETVQSVLDFLGSLFDFFTATKKNN